jgi:hypothetical protein
MQVRVKEMVVGSSVDKIYMVMEYLENDLKACMDMTKTPFSVSEVLHIICYAMFCHAFLCYAMVM